jgi:ABC-type transporter Mla maintaining outer membrane lipid asymmetry permease subunit MlaE
MTKIEVFLLVELAIAIIAGILCFKNFKNFGKAIYWAFVPNFISIWSK